MSLRILIAGLLTLGTGCGVGFRTPRAAVDLPSLDSQSSLILGSTLYSKNCQSCHGALATTSKQNKTAADIRSAINTISAMKSASHLKLLSDHDLKAIADALSSALRANPFICQSGSDPAPARLRRLTKREYLSTLKSLLEPAMDLSLLETELGQLDIETPSGVPVIHLFDTTNPIPVSLKLILAYEGVAAKAADILSADSARMNAIAGSSCISATTVSDQCVTSLLDGFGYRAYRRPLSVDEKNRHITLYRTGTSSADSFARLIHALLQSPAFLYHLTDQGTPMPGRADLLALTPHEIASRLSYTITGTMPDAALFEAARSGILATPAGLETQVQRLFNLPAAKSQAREFYSQWLSIKNFTPMTPPSDVSAGIDVQAFRSEAKQEVIEIMDELIWNRGAKYNDLLTTKLIAPRGPALSSVYGVSATSSLSETTDPRRVGILTRPGLLAKSAVGASDPVRRGVRVRVHMLCDNLGTPPADAESSGSDFDPLDSTRNQIAAKTSPSQCMACHSRINGLGFTFENFDGFGRYRLTETVRSGGQSRTHQINAIAEPNISSPQDPPVEGPVELQKAMLASTKSPACFAIQYYQFQTGRPAEEEDNCGLSDLYTALSRSDGSIRAMLREIANGPHFKIKKID